MAMTIYNMIGLFGSHLMLPSSSTCPGSPVAQGVTRTITNWIRSDHVAMYMPSWHQPWGAPLQSVIINARMRVPTKRMASMGQNITTPLQFSIVCIINAHSKPVNSLMVIAAQIQVYTKKNWKVRLMTHCMVGEIGMVYSGPCGCSIVKML